MTTFFKLYDYRG